MTSLDGKELGNDVLGQAGASPYEPTPLMGTRSLLMDGQPRRHISLCLCLCSCPSLHLLSLPLVSFCASGNATGHPGRYPPCGVPRWVQVPEGVVYATITLGTARPRAGMPVIPMPAAWLAEAGCMPEGGRHPLPVLVCILLKYTLNIDEENKVGGKLTVWFRSLLSLLGAQRVRHD